MVSVTDEADAALRILAKTKAGQSLTEADWQRLFSSEPYLRLKSSSSMYWENASMKSRRGKQHFHFSEFRAPGIPWVGGWR